LTEKEVSVKVQSLDGGNPWIETFTSRTDNPKKEFEALLNQWNIDFPDNKRKIVEIVGNTGKIYCDFHKANMLTVVRNRENYDIMECSQCKLFIKRHGLGQGFNYQRECKPDLVCVECNKQFKSKSGLKKHMDVGKHKTPEWLPDGV